MKRFIADEKGNTMIFMLGSMTMLVLMFVIIGSFANVFIIKEKASNNAEQASLAASGEILAGLNTAIELYDQFQYKYYLSIEQPELYELHSILKKLGEEKVKLSSSGRDLSTIEINHNAINNVIKDELPGISNALQGFVTSELGTAVSRVHNAVEKNINDNNGVLSGTTVIIFNKNKRVEVKTATKYKAIKYDSLFPEDKRLIKQKGEGLKFEFLSGFGTFKSEYTFP
ncbi:TadE/TadG family type IV pilus assembly protein [Cytobacillus praedii]|uniref:Uncharacterized protein n=1 Tax=Cytobacillus praedii TaxID=1742358 RepID=A0A4R1AVL7_9BACI|nr:hypothetical protein [Cytobacillus praedii]TCJ02187.1 hypothetical protein E0Y62_20520 [Cytobacillus praedii]